MYKSKNLWLCCCFCYRFNLPVVESKIHLDTIQEVSLVECYYCHCCVNVFALIVLVCTVIVVVAVYLMFLLPNFEENDVVYVLKYRIMHVNQIIALYFCCKLISDAFYRVHTLS